jgi:membrane protease YdiL (CAAX protease family)
MAERQPVEGLAIDAARSVFREEPPARGDGSQSPDTAWPAWTAPLALVGGIMLAAVGGLVLDIPAALLFGVKISGNHFPAGLSIADTVVQDIGFVLAAVFCAQLGGRAVRSWQFGLRRPGAGWASAGGMVLVLLVSFIVLTALWAAAVHPGEEKTLEQLGSNEGTALLVLSAALTCVVAPMCEEFLFRGYMFTALRNWRGTLPAAVITGLVFGGVHAESAPVLDLAPLAALGFGLCLLYRYTGSLYPCMIAHSLNNSIAFSSLEGWSWQVPVLIVSALLGIGAVVMVCKRIGLIAPDASFARAGA